MYFQLAPQTLRTGEIEFGLLPTPRATKVSGTDREDFSPSLPGLMNKGLLPTPNQRDWKDTMNGLDAPSIGVTRGYSLGQKINNLLPTPTAHQQNTQFKQGGTCLQAKAAKGLLPIPTAMDSSGATAKMKSTQVKEGSMHSVTLARALNMGLLPTPMASDSPEKNTGIRNQESVAKIAKELAGTTSQLNPRFVLEMMGFPPDWTELPFQNGETKASKLPETP
jgi:hypothetical protein